jgi:hypothetical protein
MLAIVAVKVDENVLEFTDEVKDVLFCDLFGIGMEEREEGEKKEHRWPGSYR